MLKRLGPWAMLLICFTVVAALAQQVPDFNSLQEVPSTKPPTAQYQRLHPLSIHSAPNFLNSDRSPALGVNTQGVAFALANVNSVPNFQGSFSSRGRTWPYTMIGNAPSSGTVLNIPAKIVAVALRLQNANLVTFTTVSIASFISPTLHSPNFQQARYASGASIQFADAVQRAEFFHSMKSTWHTNLRPTLVQTLTITVPRFTTVTLNGVKTQVRTYFTSKAADGRTVVFLLDRFANQQLFNLAVNEINAGRFTTGALNVTLFPNTFLYSLNSSGGIGPCCVLGFHTFLTDGGKPVESRWVFAFASWVSPGIFTGGIQDVTALSHEISEAFNDPFVNNFVPAWQFPNRPGTCQDNLETGDPAEVLANPVSLVRLGTTTFHPQTEALLQWFEQKSPSNALGGAFSFPDTKALTHPATAFGPLSCP